MISRQVAAKRTKQRFRPGMERIEERMVLSAAPVVPMMAHAQASLVRAQAVSQAVVQIQNTSSLNVAMSFRWTSSASWQNYTIPAGGSRMFWINDSSSLRPQIQFDQSVLPGNQNKLYSLSYFTYSGGGTPPASAARVYRFQNVAGGVDLYSITTQAVTGFQNDSNLTVAFQFRWNASSNYSSTVFLAPGKTYYFWASPPTASAPSVQFDQSVLPGWQSKTYSLSFNVYANSGTPPFSSARVYKFRNVAGGVDLFS
ncbi:MAG: hypothetical protein U0800_18310 [Isosphaeraceae bacterium]